MTFTAEQKSQLAKLMATENLIVEHQKIETAMFDPKNRILYLPIWSNMSGNLYDLLCGHEVGHALHTPAEGWHKEVVDPSKPKSYKHFLNVIEDIRIEKKIKRKYPGLRLPFVLAYKELLDKDFFGIKYQNLDKMFFIDRLNIYMKTHYNSGLISFSDIEKGFVKRSEETETWEDVVNLTDEIFEYSKKEQFEQFPKSPTHIQYEFDDFDDFDEYGDDFGYEECEDGSDNGFSDSGSNSDESPENSESKKTNNEKESSTDYSQSKYAPVCRTDESFRERESVLLDDRAKPYHYLNIPKPILNNIITPYDIVHGNIVSYYKNNNLFSDKFITSKVNKFKEKNNRFIDLLVKEFEMRKAAKCYSKSKTSDTGDIDISKLSSYKFDDNIFKKITTVPKGKKHGLILLLDKSGSMDSNLPGSIEQILILSMFCRKVNIPFVVYGFGNSHQGRVCDFPFDGSGPCFTENPTQLLLSSVYLREYLNSKMSNFVFNSCVRNMICLKEGFTRSYVPDSESLSNTPLIQAIVSLADVMNDFRKQNSLEFSNLIIVHDGESDGINHYYPSNRVGVESINTSRANYILTDKKNKFNFTLDKESGNPVYRATLEWFRSTTNSKIFSFFIFKGNRHNLSSAIYKFSDSGVDESMIKKFNKEKFLELKPPGYDSFFLISGGNDLKVSDDNSLNEITSESTKADIKTAFSKFYKSKTVNRVLVSRFIEGIAT
jgi:hypothetical protein